MVRLLVLEKQGLEVIVFCVGFLGVAVKLARGRAAAPVLAVDEVQVRALQLQLVKVKETQRVMAGLVPLAGGGIRLVS